MAKLSLAQRLIAQLVLGTAIVWLISVGFAAHTISHELNETFDQNLRQSAARFLPLVVHEVREESESELAEVDIDFADEVYVSFYVLDRHDRLLLAPKDLPKDVVIAPLPAGFSTVANRRYYALADARAGTKIVVVEMDHGRNEIIGQSVRSLAIPLMALLPLLALMIWLSVRQTLQPITRLGQEISKRGAKDLTVADTSVYPKELAPIAEEVNQLLLRLSDALSAERSFAASSAHELRTPIAGAIAQVQRLQHELSEESALKRVNEIEASLQRLARLSEKLLQFARLEAGFARSDVLNNLMPILELVLDDFERNGPSKGQVRLSVPAHTRLCAFIEPDAFAVAVRNLVENALAYRDGVAPIEVRVEDNNRLVVENQARAFTQTELEEIKKPFERGNAQRPGTGIGLSIVASIVKQAGGTFDLRSIESDGQIKFQVTINFGRTDTKHTSQ